MLPSRGPSWPVTRTDAKRSFCRPRVRMMAWIAGPPMFRRVMARRTLSFSGIVPRRVGVRRRHPARPSIATPPDVDNPGGRSKSWSGLARGARALDVGACEQRLDHAGADRHRPVQRGPDLVFRAAG